MLRPTTAAIFPLLLAVAVLLVATTSGCGTAKEEIAEPTASVAGTIALTGKPMRAGTINLFSFTTGGVATGPIDAKGNFKLDSPLLPGEYTVYISNVSGIPEKFYGEGSSGVMVTVVNGENDLTIDLK